MIVVRDEALADRAAVFAVNAAAFPTDAEARLVDALHRQASPLVSLVAEAAGVIAGHLLFSPVTLPGRTDLQLMGLAPMAVRPEFQRQGIGGTLIRAGLERCRQLGIDAVVVLGHPAYYLRFGFVPSMQFGINSEYPVPPEVFMAQELRPGVLQGARGTVQYHAAFAGL